MAIQVQLFGEVAPDNCALGKHVKHPRTADELQLSHVGSHARQLDASDEAKKCGTQLHVEPESVAFGLHAVQFEIVPAEQERHVT